MSPKIQNVRARLVDFMQRYDEDVSGLPTWEECETDEQAAVLIDRILVILGAAQIELSYCRLLLRTP